MSVTKKEVEHIAKLSKLKFSGEETEKLTADLNQILKHVERLNELDTSNVEPLSHPITCSKPLRKDQLKDSVKAEEALKNAPHRDENFFLVPKVISSQKNRSKK